MESAIFACPASWERRLPPEVRRLQKAEELTERTWDILVLPSGSEAVEARCRTLLLPGDCPPERIARVAAAQVVTCGLSPRDTLTLSSFAEPVLCVQRALTRPDGAVIEPQEFPLPKLPAPAAEILPLLGLKLLQMPLTEALSSW